MIIAKMHKWCMWCMV